jgi:hypothetical protein
MFVITYNVNERIFTGICKKFSGVTEANSSYRPPEKKKENWYTFPSFPNTDSRVTFNILRLPLNDFF